MRVTLTSVCPWCDRACATTRACKHGFECACARASVFVCVCVCVPSTEADGSEHSHLRQGSSNHFAGATVLVVEDDVVNLNILSSLLEGAGYDVLTASEYELSHTHTHTHTHTYTHTHTHMTGTSHRYTGLSCIPRGPLCAFVALLHTHEVSEDHLQAICAVLKHTHTHTCMAVVSFCTLQGQQSSVVRSPQTVFPVEWLVTVTVTTR